MGIFLSALTGSGGRKTIKLPQVDAIRCELIGLYQSVLDECQALLLSHALTGEGPSIQKSLSSVSSRTLKRSEVSTEEGVEDFFKSSDPHLLFVCHKITSQRTPLLDSKGLYTKFVQKGLDQCEVIIFLVDVPTVAYLYLLLSEQPTLKWLFVKQRIIPVFARDSLDDEVSTTADGSTGDDEVSSPSKIEAPRYWEDRVSDIIGGKLPPLAAYSEDLDIPFNANASPDEFIEKFYLPLRSPAPSK